MIIQYPADFSAGYSYLLHKKLQGFFYLHKNLANELSVQDLEKTLCKISVIYINHKTIMFDLSIKTRKFQ